MARRRLECKAFLKLKIPQNDNVQGLSWERYEIVDADYQLFKEINRSGEVNSDLKGGMIAASVSGVPSQELLAWMFDNFKRFNGEITVMDISEETIEQVYFDNARLTGLMLHYKAENQPNTVTRLSIVADKLQINNAYFENLTL